MKREHLMIAMFRAMECLYGELEEPDRSLLQFISDADVYIFADRKMVDPALQSDFEQFIKSRNFGDEIDPVDAYNLTKDFLAEKSVYYSELFPDPKSIPFDELFEDISIDEWKKLCEIVEREESVES